MKMFFTILSILLITLNIAAQDDKKPEDHSGGRDHLVSLDLHVPLGVFARSQFAGAGLSYSWSHHRFGSYISSPKLIGFTFNAGGDYYFGRSIQTAGHPFQYGGYFYTYFHAGIISNPKPNLNLWLTAGPTLGIYKGNADMGAGVNFFGSYYFRKNLSIGPGVTYKKHPDADALWTGTVRLSYVLGAK
jgi:hypothetical protein